MQTPKYRRCILIPADDKLPVRVIEQQDCAPEAMRQLVGGRIEIVFCPRPRLVALAQKHNTTLQRGARLFANRDGVDLGLPRNARASALHVDPLGIVVGDAFIMATP